LAQRTIALSLIFLVALTAFAQAECVRAEPPKAINGLSLSVSPSSLSGQLTMQIYLEKKGGTGSCSMAARLSQQASGFAVSMTPTEVIYTGSSYYGVFPVIITATATSASAPTETITIQFFDKDTGTQLATTPVLLSISQNTGSPSAKPACTKEDTTGCSEKDLIALQVPPSLIEENVNDIYLLVGIVAAFGLIVLLFFVLLPRK